MNKLALLLVSLLASSAVSEETSLPVFRVYLSDAPRGSQAAQDEFKKHPRYFLSSEVRKAVLGQTGRPDDDILLGQIQEVVRLEIVDDPDIVANIQCPAYGLSRYETPTEFGNWCELAPEGYRKCHIFESSTTFLLHLKYLVDLEKMVGSSRVGMDMVQLLSWSGDEEWNCPDGVRRPAQVRRTVHEFRPRIMPFPMPRLEVSRETYESVRVEHVDEEGAKVVQTYTSRTTTPGERSLLVWLGHMDLGTGMLSQQIEESLSRTYPARFTVGEQYRIPLQGAETVEAECIRQAAGDYGVTTFGNETVEVVVDLRRSEAVITRHDPSKFLPPEGVYGLLGDWKTTKCSVGQISLASEPDPKPAPILFYPFE